MTFTARRSLPILLIALAALVLSLVGGPVQAQDNTVPATPTGLTVAEVAVVLFIGADVGVLLEF